MKCDSWVVLRFKEGDNIFYKVFASWSGGYLSGDSWRLNSGIKSVTMENGNFIFRGESGSVYICKVGAYGFATNYSRGVLQTIINKSEDFGIEVEILEFDYDFLGIK